MSEDEKNKGGRPRFFDSPKNVELLLNMLKIQGTISECAGVLECSEKTIERYANFMLPGEGFVGLLKKYGSGGKMSLRRAQFHNAIKKNNTAMQIWLGKQWLGQTDRNEIELPHANIKLSYSLDSDK